MCFKNFNDPPKYLFQGGIRSLKFRRGKRHGDDPGSTVASVVPREFLGDIGVITRRSGSLDFNRRAARSDGHNKI